MINLIGRDRKRQLLAARRNSIWIRYAFLSLGTSLVILIILGGSAFYFYSMKLEQDARLRVNQAKLFTKEYVEAKKSVGTFRKNVSTAKAVFDAETYYSVIITKVAKTMPENTILNNMKFDSTTFQTQQTLDFRSKTVSDALALKAAFEENPPLSSKVRFSQISKSDSAQSQGASQIYPIQITMFMELKKPSGSTGGQ